MLDYGRTCRRLSIIVPRASSTCPDLSDPSGNVRETISLYLGNLTWAACQYSDMTVMGDLTLSSITNGPLTPPTVLYRIRGCMVVMRGSWTSFAIFADRTRGARAGNKYPCGNLASTGNLSPLPTGYRSSSKRKGS